MIKHISDDDFEKEVFSKKGICLVDFYATWCGPCMMESKVLEEIGQSRAGYEILKVDVDKNSRVASELEIDTIPTICIYKDGKLVEKRIGFMDKEQILNLIEKYSDELQM